MTERCTITVGAETTCGRPAIWIVGLEIDEIWTNSYDACDAHLTEAAHRIVASESDDPNMNGRLELQHLPRLREWENA